MAVRGVKLSLLAKFPLQKYAPLTGKHGYLTSRLQTDFHAHCVGEENEQGLRLRNDTGSAAMQLDCAFAEKRAKNRECLKGIFKGIEHLGQLGLTLRRHRDGGELSIDIAFNEGNFRALLH